MSASRRTFFRALGWGAAGLSTTSWLARQPHGHEPFVSTLEAAETTIIRLSNNENNRGPGARATDAIRTSLTPRLGRGYPPDHVNDLGDTIASIYRVDRNSVIVGTGSGPILEAAVHAFCAADKPLVTVAPTYGTPENTARRKGVPVKLVPVDRALQLDLNAIAVAAQGAGLIYVCNPNNPTGGAHNAAAIEAFVRRVKQASPSTAILLDEAYIDYAHDPAIKTATPLAMELPGVFITRSMSKAHGMAGLRLGYAVGQADTVQAMPRAWQLGSINALTAAAAIASLKDTQHIAEEVAENARVREYTLQAFKQMGYSAPDSHANCIFVDLKDRSAKAFRDACLAQQVQVGRDFPPFEEHHTRITLGTFDEMRRAMDVFRTVLGSRPAPSAL